MIEIKYQFESDLELEEFVLSIRENKNAYLLKLEIEKKIRAFFKYNSDFKITSFLKAELESLKLDEETISKIVNDMVEEIRDLIQGE